MVIVKLKHNTIYECFISGGKDSALACYIAYDEAKKYGYEFRLIYIDSGIGLKMTKKFVMDYAKWLNVDLLVIKTPFDYWELAAEHGYPLIYHNRWCIEHMKKVPLGILAYMEDRDKLNPVWVMGIRRNESLFRISNYSHERYTYTMRLKWDLPIGCLGRFTRRYWCPLINMSDKTRDKLINEYGIPYNPVWSIGISGDCLCLAGTSRKTLDKIIMFAKEYEPDIIDMMIEGDDLVQKHRRNKEPSYPAPLLSIRQTLRNYLKHIVNQRTLIKVM